MKLDFSTCLNETGHGAEDDAGGSVGDDRIQAETLEYAFQQFGDDNEQTDRKEGLMEFQSEVSSLAAHTARQRRPKAVEWMRIGK